MKIYVDVINQKLKINTSTKNLVSGSQNFIRFFFNLDSDWDGLTVFAQFRQGDVAYNQYLDNENSVYLPSEITEGTVDLSLYGTGGTVRATVNYLTFNVDKNIILSNARSTEISTSLYEQLSNRVSALAASPAGSGGDVGTEVRDARVGWDGAEYESLGEAVRTQMENAFNGSALYIYAQRFSDLFSGDFNNFPNNRMYPINIDFGTAAAASTANAPDTSIRGTLLTFGRKGTTRYNLDVQMFVTQSREKIYIRVYDGENPSTNTPGSWSAWSVVGGSSLPQYRAGINDLYASYNYLLSNVKDDGTFHVSQQATSGGTIVQRWSDLPDSESNFIVTNSGYSTNWILQTAIATNTYTDVYRRIIPRPGVNALPRNWVKQGNLDPRLKILAVGDSICAGARNGEKGFVGDLGLPTANVRNEGLSGTTMSNYLDGTIDGKDKTCIPKQLARVSGFQPDIIIANGGHNDYNYDVQMGDIPVQPTTDMNTLDASTVMGGLQRLFLTMIQNYPSAERYFVTTHKIYRNATVNPDKNGYLPTKNNLRGYSETDLHDAIVQCCKVYNVQVIDVFEKSKINSLFDVYKGDVYYSGNSEGATEDLTRYFDADGVHPLERGYLEGYVPLIREAIRTGTVKN